MPSRLPVLGTAPALAAVPVRAGAPMTDPFGRTIDYLRISVTDRCNLRCVYCMPEEGLDWIPSKQILRFEEIARIVRVMAQSGLKRVRLTGGEPTVRRDLVELVRQIALVPGIDDIAMTTNGLKLRALARPLVEAGLKRFNV